jgi:hypothetical protein
VVPNHHSLYAAFPISGWYPEDIHDWYGECRNRANGQEYAIGHGTGVASVAGGASAGAASGSELHVVKIAGDGLNPRILPGGKANLCTRTAAAATSDSIREALVYVLTVVRGNMQRYQNKSVVNLSVCKSRLR